MRTGIHPRIKSEGMLRLKTLCKIKPAPEGAGFVIRSSYRSGAGVQHGDGAAVLRPAGDVVTHRDRTLLAVGDRAHPVRIDAARGEIAAHRLGTPRTERDVVFAGAALVRVPLAG